MALHAVFLSFLTSSDAVHIAIYNNLRLVFKTFQISQRTQVCFEIQNKYSPCKVLHKKSYFFIVLEKGFDKNSDLKRLIHDTSEDAYLSDDTELGIFRKTIKKVINLVS